MDPNAALEALLGACHDWNACSPDNDPDLDASREAREAALHAIRSLGHWVSTAGFLPKDPREAIRDLYECDPLADMTPIDG